MSKADPVGASVEGSRRVHVSLRTFGTYFSVVVASSVVVVDGSVVVVVGSSVVVVVGFKVVVVVVVALAVVVVGF